MTTTETRLPYATYATLHADCKLAAARFELAASAMHLLLDALAERGAKPAARCYWSSDADGFVLFWPKSKLVACVHHDGTTLGEDGGDVSDYDSYATSAAEMETLADAIAKAVGTTE